VRRRHDQRIDLIAAVLAERDVVETAKRSAELILRSDRLVDHILLDVQRLVRQLLLRDAAALERVNRIDQPGRERRTRTEPGAGRQIAVVVDLEPGFHLHPLEHGAHRRMLDVGSLLDVLDDRVDHAKAMLEKRRQLADADVAVLVDRRRQHRAAVLAVPLRVVRAASEE